MINIFQAIQLSTTARNLMHMPIDELTGLIAVAASQFQRGETSLASAVAFLVGPMRKELQEWIVDNNKTHLLNFSDKDIIKNSKPLNK